MRYDFIIVTSYLKREEVYRELLANGADRKTVKVIFSHNTP